MSITDELREWKGNINTRLQPETVLALRSELNRIADRIDAEHEAACAEAYGNGVMSVPIALDESQWVKLPVDANGVPIHVGDKVTEHEDGHTFKVDGFMDWDGEWWVFQRDAIQAPVRRCTHHHAPTVEDVLREFAYGLGVPVADSYIAASAVKLRLAGDAE